MLSYFIETAKRAFPSDINDPRSFYISAMGIRKDTKVFSKNGAVRLPPVPIQKFRMVPEAHAEVRLSAKLCNNSDVYVVRICKDYDVNNLQNAFRLSKPCSICQIFLRAKKTNKVYYSIDPESYGIWNVKSDIHTIAYF